MKRDVNLDQLALFEPDQAEAVGLMRTYMARFDAATAQAELWDACWCPGARDAAQAEADRAYQGWLHAAIYLDLEYEASR